MRAPRWAEVLAAASDGAPLSVVAGRVGQSRTYVAARMSEAYRALGVVHVDREFRRETAVRVARRAGFIHEACPTAA